MGQFYRGTGAEFLDDAMFKLPYEMIGKVIEKKDKDVDDTLKADYDLNDLLKAQGLKPDDPRLAEIMSGYSGEISGIAENIYKDPLNATKYMGKIEGLKKKISQDWTIGEVAKIQANKAAYDIWEKAEDEKIKKNPNLYSPEQFELLKQNKMAEFGRAGGTKYKDASTYNSFSTEDALGLKPADELLKDLMDGALPGVNKSWKWENDKGGFTVSSDGKEKFFPVDQLKGMFIDFMGADPNIVAAVGQRAKLGIPGFGETFDEQGRPIIKDGNYFDNAINLMIKKYGGKEIVSGGGSKMNAVGSAEAIDDMNTVNLITEVGGTLTATAGSNNNEYNASFKSFVNTKAEAVNKGIKAYADLYYGGDVDKFKADVSKGKIFNAISSGDFSSISSTPTGKAIYSEYRQAEIKLSALKTTQAQFEKETGIPYMSAFRDKTTQHTYKDEKGVTKKGTAFDVWQNYLKTNSMKSVDRTMTWEGTGVNYKQQESVAKQFFSSDAPMTTPIYFEPGTKIGGKDVGGKKYSLNQLVQMGAIKQKKLSPSAGSSAPTIPIPGQPIQFVDAIDSSVSINLDTTGKNIMPIWGWNDSERIEFGFGVEIGGRTHLGRVDNIRTEVTDQINSGQKAMQFKTTAWLAKNASHLENYKIPSDNPNMDYTYHGKKVMGANGKVLYDANTVTYLDNGKYKTVYANDDRVVNTLGSLLFE